MVEQIINFDCQAETQDELSLRRRPHFLYGPWGLLPWLRRRSVVFVSAARTLRERGLGFTLRKTVSVGVAALRDRMPGIERTPWKTPDLDGAQLDLQPGDWVEVKSLSEIRQTLDSQRKTHGLRFTGEMKLHCGRRYRVFKRVEFLFNEFTGEQRRVRKTVLLETVFCRGEGLGCDRSCFHMWREAWLRRVDGPAPESSCGQQPLQITEGLTEVGHSTLGSEAACQSNSTISDGTKE